MKIAIANDMKLATEALRRAVSANGEHQVIWAAGNGEEAIHMCAQQCPDLLLMDLMMPVMDGVEATRIIMQATPCAILIVTAAPGDNSNLVFRAMGAGALDVTATPVLIGNSESSDTLLTKIRTIGKLIKADIAGLRREASYVERQATARSLSPLVTTLIAIGASTGGPTALAKVLQDLRLPTTAAVVIVQHIDARFTDQFAQWLSSQIKQPVNTIDEKTRITASGIFIAKTNDHLVLDQNNYLRYDPVPLDYAYRPSVDMFFQCVARHWKHQAIGILLTGMGRDGGKGLLMMRQAGMLTIAQDKNSAVYGMPRAAAELGAAVHILPVEEIGLKVQSSIDDAINAPAMQTAGEGN
jgi:two-component system response regulator WspF